MQAFARGSAALGSLLIASCGLGGAAYQPAQPQATVVEMTSGLDFSPEAVTVRRGETIEWRNTSPFTHTVTAIPELASDPAHVQLPGDAERFNADEIPPGQIYRRMFTVPGTYRYVCLPHEDWGMMGTIVVELPS